MPRYLDPKNDFIFKRIFGHHPELLKSFLNAILPLPEDCVIESLTYLPTENVPEVPVLKYSIVDVRCLDNHGRHFIVEMQLQWTGDFIKRMLFNSATTYVRQLEKGKEYADLSPVYGLALLDTKFDQSEEWFHHYQMRHAVDNNKTLDDIQLVLIELPKLKPAIITQKKLAILWLRFLKEINERTQEVDPSLLSVAPIKEALSLLEIASYNEAELLAYDREWDAVSSEKTLLSGRFAEGKAEGRAEGLAEGEMKTKIEVVHNLHQLGISIEQIAIATHLSAAEIQRILKK
ncbi:MAG: Rpn family recombination-promoting nuclease/putative transposase [Chthoniobacterales bacterium]|nr:Rpn family recombination-promoting nuclease/putative transposase [Chthoniobacterales bacterium]